MKGQAVDSAEEAGEFAGQWSSRKPVDDGGPYISLTGCFVAKMAFTVRFVVCIFLDFGAALVLRGGGGFVGFLREVFEGYMDFWDMGGVGCLV